MAQGAAERGKVRKPRDFLFLGFCGALHEKHASSASGARGAVGRGPRSEAVAACARGRSASCRLVGLRYMQSLWAAAQERWRPKPSGGAETFAAEAYFGARVRRSPGSILSRRGDLRAILRGARSGSSYDLAF